MSLSACNSGPRSPVWLSAAAAGLLLLALLRLAPLEIDGIPNQGPLGGSISFLRIDGNARQWTTINEQGLFMRLW